MKKTLTILLSLISAAAWAAEADPTNIQIPQRDSNGDYKFINIQGDTNPGEVLGFDSNGIVGPFRLIDLLPSGTALQGLRRNAANNALEFYTVTAGLTDSDYGDFTVTGSGTSATIDAGTITLAKMANLANGKLIGRATSGTGVPEAITVGSEFSLSGGTLALTNAYMPMVAGVVLQIDAGNRAVYTPTADTDAARGTALINAVAAAAAGDSIYVGPGVYNIGTTQLVLPAGSSLIGQGWGTTSLVGDKRTNNIKVATGVTVQGIKLTVLTPSSSSGHSLIGNESAAFSNVTIRDCHLVGEQDIFNGYGAFNNTAIRLVGCVLESKFDVFNHTPGTGNTIEVDSCWVLADGTGNPDSSAALSGLISRTGCTLTVRNSRIQVGLAGPGWSGTGVSVNGGTANVINCWISTATGSTTPYDLLQSGGGTINVTGGRGSGTNGAYTTSGTITDIGADFAKLAGYQTLDADLTDLADGTLTGSKVGTGIAAGNITTGTIDAARLGSGTPSSSNYLRGDGAWTVPPGGGDVSKVGTPVANQIGYWTGDGTLAGNSALTFNPGTGTFSVTNLSTTNLTVTTISSTLTQAVLDNIGTTQGQILYFNGTDWVALGAGTSGQFLKTQGAGANPVWGDALVSGGAIGAATATTPSAADNDTSVATTAFVQNEIDGTRTGNHSTPTTTNPLSPTWSGPFHAVWYGATGTINLPAASGYDGRGIIIYNTGSFTITIDPNGSEVVVRDGNVQTGGVNFTLSSGAGNFVNIISDGTRWITLGYKGTLAVGS